MKSNVIVIDTYFNTNNEEYIIICFKMHLMIIDRSHQDIIRILFSKNNEDKLYFVPKKQNYFKSNSSGSHLKIRKISYFDEEIDSFKKFFQIKTEKIVLDFWSIISPCLSAYLIKESYYKTYKDRIHNYIQKIEKTTKLKKK